MPSKIKLLDQMRHTARLKHMSIRTEEAYVQWARRFILFHQKRHPADMGPEEIRAFLTHLAVAGHVAASTQNVALQALLFLYRDVLKQPVPALGEIERAKRSRRVPVVFSQDAVHRLLAHLEGIPQLMAGLLCGAGLRLMACVHLRVKDINFGYHQITIYDGKGAQDHAVGYGEVYLPWRLTAKIRRGRGSVEHGLALPLVLLPLVPSVHRSRRGQRLVCGRCARISRALKDMSTRVC